MDWEDRQLSDRTTPFRILLELANWELVRAHLWIIDVFVRRLECIMRGGNVHGRGHVLLIAGNTTQPRL
jgi:hypothetical protein